jgi:hypothetical protein
MNLLIVTGFVFNFVCGRADIEFDELKKGLVDDGKCPNDNQLAIYRF